MADRAQGAVSFTPIVTIAADSDADAVDAIHHNIKGALGGPLTYTAADANDKWYYAPNVIVTNGSLALIIANDDDTDLVGATGDTSSLNEAAGSEGHFTEGGNIDSEDKIRFLFIKNTGTSDTSGTTTTNSIYVVLDGATAVHSSGDAIEIPSGESWMAKVNVLVDNVFVITGASRSSAVAATVNSSTSVRCTVAAIIDDGG